MEKAWHKGSLDGGSSLAVGLASIAESTAGAPLLAAVLELKTIVDSVLLSPVIFTKN
jgi:hypothetical protein